MWRPVCWGQGTSGAFKEINEKNEIKACDKKMEAGKILKALRCLPEDAKGGVLSKSDKVTINGRKTAPHSFFYKKITHVVGNPILNHWNWSEESGFAVSFLYFWKIWWVWNKRAVSGIQLLEVSIDITSINLSFAVTVVRWALLFVFSQWSCVQLVVTGVYEPRLLCALWGLSPNREETTSNHQVVLFLHMLITYIYILFCM